MKTVENTKTITTKYLEFENFDDFKENININKLIEKNDDFIDNIYGEFLEFSVEDNIK